MLPGKLNEILGIQHAKFFVVDNNVVISGANLSTDYFTDRQDRYILIKDAPKLADYFDEFTNTIESLSFDLIRSENGIEPLITLDELKTFHGIHPLKESSRNFVMIANLKIMSFLQDQKYTNTLMIDEAKDEFIEANTVMPRFNSALDKPNFNFEPPKPDTWVFPSIQMGWLGIHQDENLTTKFIEVAGGNKRSKIIFTTAYMNLADQYVDVIAHKSSAEFDILCAHPNANSFHNAPFPLYAIPFGYSIASAHFVSVCRQSKALHRVQMFEYQRSNWTFHAKGMVKTYKQLLQLMQTTLTCTIIVAFS